MRWPITEMIACYQGILQEQHLAGYYVSCIVAAVGGGKQPKLPPILRERKRADP